MLKGKSWSGKYRLRATKRPLFRALGVSEVLWDLSRPSKSARALHLEHGHLSYACGHPRAAGRGNSKASSTDES